MINYILRILNPVQSLIDRVTPKAPNLCIFFIQTDSFRGSAKYLYLYILEKKELKPYLFLKPRLYQKLKGRYPSHTLINVYSFKAVWIFFRSRIIICTHGRNLLPWIPTGSSKQLFCLQHGVIAFKAVFHKLKETPPELRFFDATIATSDFQQSITASCLKLPLEKIYVTGLPRNDLFYIPKKNWPVLTAVSSDRKVILYSPTFRDEGVHYFPFDDFDVINLQQLLKKHNAALYIKNHPNEPESSLQPLKKLSKEVPSIQILDDDDIPDVQELLLYTDVFITDYSSIYWDFLLLNRPIIFVPYDLKEYRRSRGFMIDYEKYTVGPKVNRFDRFLYHLDRYLVEPDHDANDRAKMAQLFHKYQDGGSTERAYLALHHFIHSNAVPDY